MKQGIFIALIFATAQGWSQISKVQIYEMTEKGVDEAILVSMITQNCVDFDLDGETVVELASRVTPATLSAIVDCVREQPAVEDEEPKPVVVAPKTTVVKETAPVNNPGFNVPQFITVQLESNKSSFTALEIEFRMVPLESGSSAFSYRVSGDGQGNQEDDLRLYKKEGPAVATPGDYVAYLYVVSSRKKGAFGKKEIRTDLHKFHMEYDGPGPIVLEYNYKEGKMYSRKKDVTIEVHGPLSLYGEEHVSVEQQKALADLLSLFKS